MKDNKWARLLVYITGLVNQKLLLQNEYLIAENRILRAQLPQRLQLTDPQRSTLAEIGKRLGTSSPGNEPLRHGLLAGNAGVRVPLSPWTRKGETPVLFRRELEKRRFSRRPKKADGRSYQLG
jgi:hypothetical protein